MTDDSEDDQYSSYLKNKNVKNNPEEHRHVKI
jgi:hypothetical protein